MVAEARDGGSNPEIKRVSIEQFDPNDFAKLLPDWRFSPPNQGSMDGSSLTKVFFQNPDYPWVESKALVSMNPPKRSISFLLDGPGIFRTSVFNLDRVVEVELDEINGKASFYTEDRKGWYSVSGKGKVHAYKNPSSPIEYTITLNELQ